MSAQQKRKYSAPPTPRSRRQEITLKRARTASPGDGRKTVKMFTPYNLPKQVMKRLGMYMMNDTAKRLLFPLCAVNRRMAMKIVKKLPRASASMTIQYLAEYSGNNLFLKVSFKTSAKEARIDNSLIVEREIYRYVTNPLILKRNTPFLVAYYGFASCQTKMLPEKIVSRAEKDQIAAEGYDMSVVESLVLERARGRTLDKWIETKNYGSVEEFWRPLMFEVVWTLLCFKDVGLVHNDLHWQNVFVARLPQKVRRSFIYSERDCYTFETDIFVSIFDYDYSSKFATQHNSRAFHNTSLRTFERCQTMGVCNTYNEKRDIAKLLFFILQDYYTLYTKEIIRFFDQICDTEVVEFYRPPWTGWLGSYCRCDHGYNDVDTGCHGKCRDAPPSDKSVKTLRQMLDILGKPYRRGTCRTLKADPSYDAKNVWVLPRAQHLL